MPPRRRRGGRGGDLRGRGDGGDRGRGRVGRGRGGGSHGIRSDVDENNRPRTRRRIAAASSNSSTHNSTPAAAPSIRDNARDPSRSTGSQHSQDSSTSFYNLEYHHSRNESSMTGGGTNLNTARLNPRICICDCDERSMFGRVDIAWFNMQLKNIEDATPQLRAETIMYLG
mmetsp:Transcript_19063/g.32473  ORF Transcript_19063/g.32473 Transcript_19063/m.32473 type:complete len:171 (+) Transcript_19063:408-920(+)